MKIFHLAAAGAIALAFISCEPQYYLLNMEKRGASSSGVNLLGKNISLVYVADEETEVFSNAVATGFAQTLEKELSSGEETIGIFSVPPGGENYGSRDSLVKFLIETGDDVIMLLDRPLVSGHKIVTNRPGVDLGVSADSLYLAEASASFSLKMYYYDSMGKEDDVRSFSGTNTIHPTFFNPGELPEAHGPRPHQRPRRIGRAALGRCQHRDCGERTDADDPGRPIRPQRQRHHAGSDQGGLRQYEGREEEPLHRRHQ